MRWQAWGLGAGLFGISAGVHGQELPPAPPPPPPAEARTTQPADSVAPPPQSVKVGDVIMAPALAGDDEAWQDPTAAKAAKKRWYGGPILLTDGIAYGSIGLGFGVRDTAPAALPIGFLTYALGGPIVHLAHGNWGRSAISVGVRAVLPIVGLAIGANTHHGGYDDSSGGDDRIDGLVGGLFGGMAAATLVDAALVAHEPVSESPTVAPTVSVGKDHAFIGATGTF